MRVLVSRLGLVTAMIAFGPLAASAQTRPEVRVSGLFLGSWSMDLGPGAERNNRFEVNRAYLTLSGRLSERVTGRMTTDAIREDNEELEVRLKYAFVAYEIPKAPLTVRFGLTQTPFVEYEEALWEHRMQGSIPADRFRYLSSSDLGVVMDGVWGTGAQLQVTSGVYNGEGWTLGNSDAGKDWMTRATVRLASSNDPGPMGGLRLTGYLGVGSPTGGGTRQRTLGMLAWRSQQLTLATQALVAKDRVDAPDGTEGATTDSRLLNSFAVIKVPRTTLLFIGRLELLDPNLDAPNDRQTRVIGGVGVKLAPELRLLGSVEHLSYQGGAPTPALDASRVRGIMHVALTF